MSGRTFECVLPLHFGDVDYARILYYPRLFHFCHVAMETFFDEALRLAYPAFLADWKRGFPAVHTEADYLRPLPYGISLRVAVSVVRIGESSLVWRYRFTADGEEALRAEARVTTVCVDMDLFEKRPVPDALRARLEPFVEEPGT